MKKHNEGYTLPLVMVVLLVLAIVAVTIMTTSLKNMLRQQKFIEQMQAQYQAQGEIEKVVAQVENLGKTEVQIPLSSWVYDAGTQTISASIKESGGEGDNKVTILCEIVISASEIKYSQGKTDRFDITGEPTVTYTSYEIVKGGATE